MNNIPEKYLPIGTLVKLHDDLKRVMIIGFYMKLNKVSDKIYDYIGCIYPNGLLKTTEFFAFNHEDIKEVSVLGHIDEEEKKFKEELMQKIKNVGVN